MMERLMLTIGHALLHLVGWKPKAQRAYERGNFDRVLLSTPYSQVLDQMIAAHRRAMQIEPYHIQPQDDLISRFMLQASRPTAHGPLPEPLQPQYEEMLHTGYEAKI